MLQGLLLEYTGTVLIIGSLMYTHSNPVLVGLAYMVALFLADGKSEGFFTPLGVLVQYLLGRLTLNTALKLVATHIAAAVSIYLFYVKNL